MREEIQIETGLAKPRVFCVEIRGLTPLLMHSPRGMAGKKESVGPKSIPSPEVEAESATYRTSTGLLCLPSDNLRESILAACKGIRINKVAARPLMAAALSMLVPEFELMRNGETLATFDRIDIRRCVVMKAGIMRARAMIECPWSTVAKFVLDTAVISKPGSVVQIVQEAGLKIGIMDYRPEKGGVFGRFEVVRAWTEDL